MIVHARGPADIKGCPPDAIYGSEDQNLKIEVYYRKGDANIFKAKDVISVDEHCTSSPNKVCMFSSYLKVDVPDSLFANSPRMADGMFGESYLVTPSGSRKEQDCWHVQVDWRKANVVLNTVNYEARVCRSQGIVEFSRLLSSGKMEYQLLHGIGIGAGEGSEPYSKTTSCQLNG